MTDAEAITDLLVNYAAALKSGDVEAAVSLYTSDGVFMAPGYSAVAGEADLRKAYQRVCSTIRLSIKFDIMEIVPLSAGWAFARSIAEGTKTWIQEGKQETHANQELFILQKVDGHWKIARYAFSSMKPIG